MNYIPGRLHVTPHRLVALGVAELLAELSFEVESLGADLCSDPELARRHGSALQAVDLVAQKLCGLADLLSAESPATVVARLRLDSLRDRFAHLQVYTEPGQHDTDDDVIWN